MDRSRDSVARRLAEAHFRLDSDIDRIFRVLAPDAGERAESEPIKLLEVNPNTPKDGIIPVYFGAHAGSGIFYPSIIVEIHPDELADLVRGTLKLPDGWSLGPEYQRPREVVSA
jgi:hypothetical protein